LTGPDEARRRGRAARQAVIANWSMDRMADAHVALFERILRGDP
jgi:hypothetical protein